MLDLFVRKVSKQIPYYSIHILDDIEPHFFTINRTLSETYGYKYSLLVKQAKQYNGKFVKKAFEIDCEEESGYKYKEYLNGFVFEKRKDANRFLREVIKPFFTLRALS